MIHLFLIMLSLLIASPALGATRYASPGGSGSSCTNPSTPCSLNTTINQAVAGDTVILKDGTYSQKMTTVRSGTSSSPIVFQSETRHGAKIRWPKSGNGTGGERHVSIQHSYIHLKQIEVWCQSAQGGVTWDCLRYGNNNAGDPHVTGFLGDDLYIHHGGNAGFNCFGANNGELRNSTLYHTGLSGDGNGSAFYLGSFSTPNRECDDMHVHHNIIGNWLENSSDFKDNSFSNLFEYNLFENHTRATSPGYYGDGTIRSEGAAGSSPSTIRNSIYRNIRSNYTIRADDGRINVLDNVFLDLFANTFVNSNTGSTSLIQNNITCPSTGISLGSGGTTSGNQLNQARSSCNTRAEVNVLGRPDPTTCEIGSFASDTVVLNVATAINGPLFHANGVTVTYDNVTIPKSSTTIVGNQARIKMSSPPANSNVSVKVVASAGSIANSAFIGGKNCDGGSWTDPSTTGNGICGYNTSETLTCTNSTPVPSIAGRFQEPTHNTTTDPGATVISASGCEATLEGAAPGSTYLLNAGTCTASVFSLDNITIYPNNNAVVTLQGSGANTLALGANVTIGGIKIDAKDSDRCITINGDNVEVRNSLILGGDTGDCVRIESGDGIVVDGSRINGGAGPLGSSGHNVHCRGTGTGTTPTNVVISRNEIYKDAAEIGWSSFGSGTEDLIEQRNCGDFTVTQNWFRTQVSNGEEFVDFKESRDGFTQKFTYNFLDCRQLLSSKDAMILQVESDHETNASTNTTDIYGNVFYKCDTGTAHGALTYAASDSKPNQMRGDLMFNLVLSDGDGEPVLQVRELTNSNIQHNTIINGQILFNTGTGTEPENLFTTYSNNVLDSLGSINNTEFNATSCSHNNIFGSTGSLDVSCTNTTTLNPTMPDCSPSNTNLDCTPSGTAFLTQAGSDGFVRGALVPPLIDTAEVSDTLGVNSVVIDMTLYSTAFAHDPAPLQLIDTSKITVRYNGVVQNIFSWQVNGGTQIVLGISQAATPSTVITMDAARGWCQDSSDLGFAQSVIGHQINALCPTVSNLVITNSLSGAGPSLGDPPLLAVDVVSPSQVNTSWTIVEGATTYLIERCAGSGCNSFSQVGNSSRLIFHNTGLAATTLYRYRVRATDGVSFTDYSTIQEITTLASGSYLRTGLLGHYQFNGDLLDAAGANDLGFHTLGSTTPTYTTGVYDQGLVFTGIDYASVGSHTLNGVSLFADNTQTWSVAGWAQTGGIGTIIGQAVSTSTDRDFQIGMISSGAVDFWLRGGFTRIQDAVYNDDSYHFYTVTWDGTSAVIYIDNAVKSASATVGSSEEDILEPILLGARTDGTAYHFVGSMDEVRFYSKALTATEVGLLYQSDTTVPSIPTGLTITPTQSSLDLDWDASTDNVHLDAYEVWRCDAVGCSNFAHVATVPWSLTAYSDTNLVDVPHARYIIRAVDAAGNYSGFTDIIESSTVGPGRYVRIMGGQWFGPILRIP